MSTNGRYEDAVLSRFVDPRNPTGIAIVGCGYWGVNYVRVFG
jgi:hypothetical protein